MNTSVQPVVFHWNASADGTLTYFSGPWFEYTGLEPQECFESAGWLSALHPLDRDCLASMFRDGEAAENRYEVAMRIRGRDGLFREFIGVATPERDGNTVMSWAGYCMSVEEPAPERTMRSA
jgi:PAS domain-containing protein